MRLCGICLAALAALPASVRASNRKGCTGTFECSGFDFGVRPGLAHSVPGTGALECTYGHTELQGSCEAPCSGTRYATCRCKTQEEAEDSVRADAQASLYAAVAAAVMGLLCVGCLLKRLMRQPSTTQEPAPEDQGARLESNEPVSPEGIVVQATVVGTQSPDQVQGNQAEVVAVDPITRSASRLDNVARANPNKARLISGVITVLVPLSLVVYWCVQVTQSDAGVMDEFSLFMGLVAIIMYVVIFVIIVLQSLSRMGWRGLMEALGSNPAMLFTRSYSKIFLGLPVVGAAGIIWALNRMNNPEGVYSVC